MRQSKKEKKKFNLVAEREIDTTAVIKFAFVERASHCSPLNFLALGHEVYQPLFLLNYRAQYRVNLKENRVMTSKRYFSRGMRWLSFFFFTAKTIIHRLKLTGILLGKYKIHNNPNRGSIREKEVNNNYNNERRKGSSFAGEEGVYIRVGHVTMEADDNGLDQTHTIYNTKLGRHANI